MRCHHALVASFALGLFTFASLGCGGAVFTSPDTNADASTATGGNGGTETTGSAGSATAGTIEVGVGGSVGTGAGGDGAGGGGAGDEGFAGSVGHVDAAVDCTAGSVTFHMTEAHGTDYCVGFQCANVWVSVKSMSGQVMSLSGGCLTTCDACMPILCAAGGECIAPQHMKPEGETLTWDGTYQEQSKCGANIACQNKQCAAPGKYVVTMCANRSTSDAGIDNFCMADPTPTCVDVPFDYPGTAMVEGVVGQ